MLNALLFYEFFICGFKHFLKENAYFAGNFQAIKQ